MPILIVPTESAVPVRRPRGQQLVIVNQSTVNVYFDEEPQRLNASTPLVEPMEGTKLAANGGEYTWTLFPGVMWFRAPTYTQIEVQG